MRFPAVRLNFARQTSPKLGVGIRTGRRLFALPLLTLPLLAQVPTAPIEGLRDASPRVHAITSARIVPAPGRLIERGTVVIRDGMIVSVGADTDVKVPAEARVWPAEGRTIYAGFIDPQSEAHLPAAYKVPVPADDAPARGSGRAATPAVEAPPVDAAARSWNPRVTPERSAARVFVADERGDAKLRELGFTSIVSVPGRGVFRGQSALIDLGGKPATASIVRPSVAQQVAFELSSGREGVYPTSLMGAIALVRQTLIDAQWLDAAQRVYFERTKQGRGIERPETNASLAALVPAAVGAQPIVFEAQDELDVLRIQKIVDEFKLRAVIRAPGTEYRVLNAVAAGKTPLIVTLNFPTVPEVETPDKADDVSLEKLQHWELAPSNPAKLAGAGVTFAFTATGLKMPEQQFWTNLRLALKRGLAPDVALAALTTNPAKMLGVDEIVGEVIAGKAANLIVASGDLFSSDATADITDVWVDGDHFETDAAQRADVRGTWKPNWIGATGPSELRFDGRTAAKPRARFGEKDATATVARDEVTILPAADLFGGKEGTVRLSARLVDGGLVGTGLLPDGKLFRWTAERIAPATKLAPEAKPPEKFFATADAYPAGTYGRKGLPAQPEWLLVKNATLWTGAAAGRIAGGDLLIHAGKIEKIGTGLIAPAGAEVIDAAGKNVTAGIIDCHSHTGISRGVNEGTSAVSCEVRIGDVIDATDIALYRELAGGVTTANVLHGSANPMGGQNQVIKLRWGGLPEDYKFAGAKPGVKFALGENVKQSNWQTFGQPLTRYPQTRMGVEQLMQDEFAQARDYDRAWTEFRAGKRPYAPRRDLRLEAVLEIAKGDRVVHIHSYRQDELLMFIRLAQKTGITVATFQHVLEGYKVADEIAKLGAGGSCFSDWWAYKYEVVDAIPYDGALMRAAGVTVSFNSDSNELARRLNTEAAKAVKYGGVPEDEAWKFVTLNAAQQLRIDNRVGSLEPGKDADFVIWSASPLSTYARAEQTWIDGRRYFSLADDEEMRRIADTERESLAQKALTERMRVLATAAASGAAGGNGARGSGSAPPPPVPEKPSILRLLDALEEQQSLQYRAIYHDGHDRDNCSTTNALN